MSTETPATTATHVNLDGPTKPYNLRLTRTRVAAAMDKPETGDLSLARLIDKLLLEYVEKA